MGKIYVGWAEESIIPEKKASLAGQFFERISEYVESDITVTALAVEADGEQMIMASADLVKITDGQMKLSREKLAKLAPDFDTDKLIVAVTHTHTSLLADSNDAGPSSPIASTTEIIESYLPEGQKYEEKVTPDDSVCTPKEALELITDKIALAAYKAWSSRAEAYYTNEFGRAAVGMNRRVCYDDGTAKMWGDTNSANFIGLEGGNDSGIELLYFFDKNKKLTGVAANIACPSQILEQRSFISADFWGRTKAYLRERFGEDIYLLSLCGAGGDQCPRDLVRWVEPETPIDDPNIDRQHVIERKADPSMFDIKGCNRVGRRIANEIIAVYDEIEEADLKSEAVFEHKALTLNTPLRKVTPTQHENAIRELEFYVEKNKDKGNFDFVDIAKMYIYAGEIIRFQTQQFTELFPIEYHVVRFGDIAFATNPYELFLDFALRIKARSYAKQTFIVQLSCGAHGYLPTAQAEAHGHYSAYITSGETGHEGGDLLVRETITQINEMFSK